MASLRLERLRPRLLDPVTLTVAAGTLLFLSGPSGAGKSLLLRAVADLDPNDGEAFVGELARSSLSASQWRRRVGLLPAESGWWDETVGAHFPARPAPDDARQRKDSVQSDLLDLLPRLGFEADVLGWAVSRLSTGERQRLALARLLAVVVVVAPSKARRLLPGESPGRVRASHPPVSSVGPAAEWRKPRTNLQGKRTQRIL
jgi:putative ABC transport system ATP-binding protein